MHQEITIGIKKLIENANLVTNIISISKAKNILYDKKYIFIDLRDIREIKRDGKIPTSYSCPRGMLEFWIDPQSPYHKKIFNMKCTYIFYCATAWRSALASKTAMEMGLKPVLNLEGGFKLWKESGGKIEKIN